MILPSMATVKCQEADVAARGRMLLSFCTVQVISVAFTGSDPTENINRGSAEG